MQGTNDRAWWETKASFCYQGKGRHSKHTASGLAGGVTVCAAHGLASEVTVSDADWLIPVGEGTTGLGTLDRASGLASVLSTHVSGMCVVQP